MRTKAMLLLAGVGAAAWWRSRRPDATRRDATRRDAGSAPGGAAAVAPDDVVRLLREGWAGVSAALDGLGGLPVASKADQLQARQASADAVSAAVRLDAAAEEVVWPVARVHGAHPVGLLDDADERGVALRRALHALDEVRPGDPTWAAAVASASAAVREHSEWAQTALWPQLDALDPGRRSELGRRLRQAQASAPTRPHLATPGAHPRADRLRARVDRLVDAAGNRRR